MLNFAMRSREMTPWCCRSWRPWRSGSGRTPPSSSSEERPMPDGVRLLASTTLFRGFSEAELEPLASRLQPRSFPRGAYVFREGDPGHTFYLIADGQVKIAHLGRQGEEIVFALLTTGDTFGELAVFDEDSTRAAVAQATEPTDCLVLNREPFMTFAESHPPLMRHLITVFGVSLRRAGGGLAVGAAR